VSSIGDPEWTKSRKYASLSSRKANEDELDRLIEQWTLRYTPEEVMDRLQRAGVPAGAVRTIAEAMEKDPQLRHREHFVPVEHPGIGRVSTYGWPFKLSRISPKFRSAPTLGEQNYSICTEILGMSDDQLSR